jgi:folate-binding protein YgfZ
MIADWQTFLDNAGAELDGERVRHYGNPRRELSVAITGNVFADLTHYGLVSVHGEDAQSFLQGQLTNDLRAVDEQHSQLSGHCNAKGRLLATFRVFRRGDSHYLCLPTEMIENLLKRLRMYVLRARVTLEDASDTFVHLGVSGSDCEEELRDFAGDIPAAMHGVCQDERQLIVRVPGIHPSFEIFTDVDQARELWTRLNVRSAPIGAEAWQLLDIQAGVPMIYPKTSEAFVPQMVNLQLVDGVSFRKGCYPGQEIVARMQYLGKLKRRMYKIRIDTDAAPQPGDDIVSPSDPNQSAGKLVSAAAHPDGGYAALAVLQIATVEQNPQLRLDSGAGPNVTLEHLPYPFPAE